MLAHRHAELRGVNSEKWDTILAVMIHTENLTKAFGATTAVDDLSFDVNEGEVFGFLGPNGAGKTTTVRLLTSLIEPTSGTARVNGFQLGEAEQRYPPDGWHPDRNAGDV